MTHWLELAMRFFARRYQREQEELLGDAPRHYWEERK